MVLFSMRSTTGETRMEVQKIEILSTQLVGWLKLCKTEEVDE